MTEKRAQLSNVSSLVLGATDFPEGLIKEFTKDCLKNSKVQMKPPAIKLFSEVMGMVAREGALRAAEQAKLEGCSTVTNEHLEKILTQLLLDIP